jgi:hypothetical protein
MRYNVECVLSAKSGQTAADWGNSTGTGVKWDDLIGANASTYDAIPSTGSTTLLDVCLGINDTSNDTNVSDIDTIKANIKSGIDNLLVSKPDLLVNLTQPNRLRNQGLKTSKLIQVMKELSEENGWSMIPTVEMTLPTVTDAFNRSELYVDDTHPNDEGQRLIARAILSKLIPEDAPSRLVPNCPQRLTKGESTYDSNVENGFDFIHIALNDGWEQVQLWKFDSNTYFFTVPDGSSSSSRSFKPSSNTETTFPADNGNNIVRIYESSPPSGGGTWNRTRAFTYKVKDTSQLDAIPVGEKIPLNPALIHPYPSRAFVHPAKVRKPRAVVDTFFQGVPTASQKVFIKRMTEGCRFHYNFNMSKAIAVTAATASTQFQIKLNGSQIGLITFDAGQTEATISTNPFAIYTVKAGDLLEIVAPNPADATLADISFVLFAVDAE